MARGKGTRYSFRTLQCFFFPLFFLFLTIIRHAYSKWSTISGVSYKNIFYDFDRCTAAQTTARARYPGTGGATSVSDGDWFVYNGAHVCGGRFFFFTFLVFSVFFFPCDVCSRRPRKGFFSFDHILSYRSRIFY